MLTAGEQIGARRFAYEEANGPIPSGMRIGDAACSRLCVNPAHLKVVPKGRVAHKTRDELFQEKIDTSSGPDACWPWKGATQKNKSGHFPYPIFSWWDAEAKRNFTVRAARYAWEKVHGPLGKRIVRHVVCRNPICMNLRHMAAGTHKDNHEDAVRDGTVVFLANGKRAPAWRPPGTT